MSGDLDDPRSLIFHIAERAAWEAARDTGRPYEVSTRGRTLAEEGFIHASRDEEQVRNVRRAFYAGLDDLVLLVIDPEDLDVRHEPVGDDVFPHIYGPIPPSAVIDVRALPENR
ncbi:DUF952 domain-containing protein [Actinoallomurus purpureus]|uniref:DUF952 domain-containing protein n=1 Tax=Actinoallomurus purpureus TaxID=478114 RepID=UPI002092C3E1|nr:DUF952 domain-containing protein [Actinoallomurus purpureus]MCO6007186.1 DUF952 domain-containing protein [Actinoallomurus purpureus]